MRFRSRLNGAKRPCRRRLGSRRHADRPQGGMRMGPMFFRIVEITFASYMVPALLVPLVWVAAWLLKRHLRSSAQPAAEVEGQSRLLFWLFLVWLVLFLAVVAGVPFYRGGGLAVVSVWIGYAG